MRRHIIFSLPLAVLLFVSGCCGPFGPGPNPDEGEVDLNIACDAFDIISPSYEFYKSMNDIPSFSCEIRNDGSEKVTVLVNSEVVGYSGEFEQTIMLSPGATKTVDVHYSFGEKFYDLNDATSAMLKTRFTVDGQVIRSDSENVQIEKSSVFSPDLGDEELIAMWVTYNDPCIEEIISEAKKFAPNQEFLGYLGDESTMGYELAAVFYALYYQDIKYVSSTFSTTSVDTAFYEQDIRFPYRSLRYKQMNCIDGAVLYSAILEKLDYETGIAFIPGHAFVVVDDGYGYWIPIETTVTGDEISSFEDAVAYGYEAMEDPELVIIDVHGAIERGISPMPIGTHECDIEDLSETAEAYRELVYGGGMSGGACTDPDYGYMESGDCSYDNAAYCYNGVVYWDDGTYCGGGSGDLGCTDPDYGYMENGECSYDNAAYCYDGLVYWDMDGSECGGVYPGCMDSDYGYIPNGYCSYDDAVYCIDGVVYWASPGDCTYSTEAAHRPAFAGE